MTRRASSNHAGLIPALVAVAWLAGPAWAEPSDAGRTRIVFQLDRESPINIQSRFQASPPAIVLEFPEGQVFTALPERTAIRSGAVLGLSTQYGEAHAGLPAGRQGARSLRAIEVLLRGDYPHRVTTERGRIILEIQHPQTLSAASIEVGVLGGSIIRNLSSTRMTQRFQAMQEALTDAQEPALVPATPPARPGASAAASPRVRRPSASAPSPARAWGWLMVLGFSLIGVLISWLRRRAPIVAVALEPRIASGMTLIDQLVLRAFERQGFRIVSSLEPGTLPGTVRLVSKDGAPVALGCVGSGMFFEKQTVERFVKVMRAAGVSQGYLVATGAFTVPAQRLAKERGVTLVGREHVVELLSAGATSEFFTRQLEDAQRQLTEGRETLQHYAAQLDALRRQRNEASWRLGEERAKAGKLDTDIAALTVRVGQQDAELARTQQDAAALQKRWDENEWYLGETRARIRFLEASLESAGQAEALQQAVARARDEANWYLGEERRKVMELSGNLVELQNALDASVARELLLQEAFDEIRRKLSALETYGERRRGVRTAIPEAMLELWQHGKDEALFAGSPRDFSLEGVGLDMDRELPTSALRARLRLPGLDAPVDSEARVVWQRTTSGEPPNVSIGCRWLTLPEPAKARLEVLLAGQPGAS